MSKFGETRDAVKGAAQRVAVGADAAVIAARAIADAARLGRILLGILIVGTATAFIAGAIWLATTGLL